MSGSPVQQTAGISVRQISHFIAGDFVPALSGHTFESINPATGEVIATVAAGDAHDMDRAVASALHAYEEGPWPRMSLQERCRILSKIGDLILDRKAMLAQAETMDTGKPITESLEGDIPRSAQNFHFFADFAQAGSEACFSPTDSERYFVVREPVGVVGLITPWNLPLYLATWKIAPCLAMGNTCVLKPAEWTPYTAFLLGEIVQEAGLPPGVLNIVQGHGAGSAGEALTRHPNVSAISFTGETGTGRAIMAAAAPTLKKVSFELGGKGANIIFADANLEEALPATLRAAFRNQGQICLAGSRLLVQESVYDTVLARLVEDAGALRVGDPLSPQTQMGALIHSDHLAKVMHYIRLGEAEGTRVIGGQRLSEYPAGNFLSPGIFTDLAHDSRFCQEEIFGPVLPVIPFKTEEDAIRMASNTPYGLSASLWSADANRCHRVSKQLKTGMVWVNCWFARDLRTPFGGQKASGIGREGGRYSLEFFSEAKTIGYRYSG